MPFRPDPDTTYGPTLGHVVVVVSVVFLVLLSVVLHDARREQEQHTAQYGDCEYMGSRIVFGKRKAYRYLCDGVIEETARKVR